MKKKKSRAVAAVAFFAVSLLGLSMAGCSALTIPTPKEIAQTPLGTESVKIGMTKQQVESLWGKPDSISMAEDKEKWTSPREVWTYRARYGSIPVNAGYLSEDKKLYFDGINLTEIE